MSEIRERARNALDDVRTKQNLVAVGTPDGGWQITTMDVRTAGLLSVAPTLVPALCDEVDRLRRVTDIIDPESVHREQRDESRAKLTRLTAALTELAYHGDLTPSGKRVLTAIIDGKGEPT